MSPFFWSKKKNRQEILNCNWRTINKLPQYSPRICSIDRSSTIIQPRWNHITRSSHLYTFSIERIEIVCAILHNIFNANYQFMHRRPSTQFKHTRTGGISSISVRRLFYHSYLRMTLTRHSKSFVTTIDWFIPNQATLEFIITIVNIWKQSIQLNSQNWSCQY